MGWGGKEGTLNAVPTHLVVHQQKSTHSPVGTLPLADSTSAPRVGYKLAHGVTAIPPRGEKRPLSVLEAWLVLL